MEQDQTAAPRLRVRVTFADGSFFGPGKADLLDLIAETGSIAAAGRRMKMSYKRAWSLVETMNAMFEDPLVESSRGGEQGGGARLTETGQRVLDHYRGFLTKAEATGAEDLSAIARMRRTDG